MTTSPDPDPQTLNSERQALYRAIRRPDGLVALGFGSGLFPVAPGTAGSLAALLCVPLLDRLSLIPYLALLAAVFFVGVWLCQRVGARLDRHDHPAIVIDEWVGLWLALMIRPPGWLWLLLGFLLFRAFDILKPWPIRWLDKQLKGGFGVMLDDLVAGVFASVCLLVLAFLLGEGTQLMRL